MFYLSITQDKDLPWMKCMDASLFAVEVVKAQTHNQTKSESSALSFYRA